MPAGSYANLGESWLHELSIYNWVQLNTTESYKRTTKETKIDNNDFRPLIKWRYYK